MTIPGGRVLNHLSIDEPPRIWFFCLGQKSIKYIPCLAQHKGQNPRQSILTSLVLYTWRTNKLHLAYQINRDSDTLFRTKRSKTIPVPRVPPPPDDDTEKQVSTCVNTSGRHFYHMEYFHLFKISFGQGQKGQLSGVDNRVVSVDKGVWMKVIQQKEPTLRCLRSVLFGYCSSTVLHRCKSRDLAPFQLTPESFPANIRTCKKNDR